VSDIATNWIAVSRSAWRQRLRLGALALTAGVAAAVLLVHLSGSRAFAALGGACAICAAALLGRARGAPECERSWRIGRDGRVSVRWDRSGADRSEASAVFVSSFLIVLRHDRRSLEIWRDATPATAFRRLAVAARWRVERAAPVVDLTHGADRT